MYKEERGLPCTRKKQEVGRGTLVCFPTAAHFGQMARVFSCPANRMSITLRYHRHSHQCHQRNQEHHYHQDGQWRLSSIPSREMEDVHNSRMLSPKCKKGWLFPEKPPFVNVADLLPLIKRAGSYLSSLLVIMRSICAWQIAIAAASAASSGLGTAGR